jgi:hypothetical protein
VRVESARNFARAFSVVGAKLVTKQVPFVPSRSEIQVLKITKKQN